MMIDAEELVEDDTEDKEDSDDEFDDKFERELQIWERRMELDTGHSSRMRRVKEFCASPWLV